jgi:hypothetical protein
MEERSTNGANGRDHRGRFQPGCPPGPGNPWVAKVAAYRAAWHAAVTDEDLRDIARALVTEAKAGDVAAARVVLSYCLGSPDERHEIAHDLDEDVIVIDADEFLRRQRGDADGN